MIEKSKIQNRKLKSESSAERAGAGRQGHQMTVSREQKQHGEKCMRKTVIASVLSAMFFALGLSAEAQQLTKIPRIGFLFIGSKDQPHLDSFRQGLRDLGYVEGKNIAIEYRYAEGKPDALPALAAEDR